MAEGSKGDCLGQSFCPVMLGCSVPPQRDKSISWTGVLGSPFSGQMRVQGLFREGATPSGARCWDWPWTGRVPWVSGRLWACSDGSAIAS